MPSYKDNKTGKWYCQFYYKDWTGANRHKVKRGFERKKDADAWEVSFKSKDQFNDIRMDALLDEYVKNLYVLERLGTIRTSTVTIKINVVKNYIRNYFRGVIVRNIKTKDINEWLKYLSTRYIINGYVDSLGRKYPPHRTSSQTLSHAKSTLNQIFKFGIENYGLNDNPIINSQTPEYFSNDKRANFLTLEQYKTFYNSLTTEYHRVFFNILYWSGARIGEVMALTPNDIVPFKIIINKSFCRDTKTIGKTKTKSSIREAEIPHALYYQIKNYMDKVYDLKPTDRLFTFSQSSVAVLIKRRCDRLDIPKISVHTFRHSYATLLYNHCKDISVVSKQLGHTNSKITLSVYSHMLPHEDRKAIDSLENLMSPTSNTINI